MNARGYHRVGRVGRVGKVGKILLLVSALGLPGCNNETRKPFIFEIPAGYKGWVSVRFFQPDPGCPALLAEGDKPVVRIPANGRLCTGSPLGFGKAADEYYYVDASGSPGSRIDAKADVLQEHVALEGAAPDKRIYERFFVGTEAELKSSPEPHLE